MLRKIYYVVRPLAFSLLFASNAVFAQNSPTDAGSKILLGSFAFTSAGGDLFAGGDNGRLTTIQFNPSYSVFIQPGLALGAKMILQRSSQDDFSTTTIAIGPQVIYFFGDNQAKSTAKGLTYPYLGITAAYQNIDLDFSSASGFLASGGLGLTYMLSNSIGLFGEANYQFSRLSSEGESATGNQINLVAGFMFFMY